jgi:Ca-activated chloride channel family protein
MQSPDKLALLKDCLRLLTQQLRPVDRVAMVVYAGNAGLVLDITNGSDKQTILDAINRLEAGGSTAGGAGIQLAYKIARQHFNVNGNNRVILATDGDFNVGITQIGELTRLIESERESGVFLSVLGFGSGNTNDETMETLADKGNGNYNYIDNLMEGKKVLVNEMGGTLFTVAKDVKLQVEFNPKYVQAYRLIGYENRLLNKEDFNNDVKDAGDIGAGHCVTALYELIPVTSKNNPVYVDPLRYQQLKPTTIGDSLELANISIRYKEPKNKTSIKFEHPVLNTSAQFDNASENLRFAVTVALFGMKLRNAAYTEQITYKQIVKTGKSAKGEDQEGYRAELIKLIQTAELLAGR